MTLNPSFALTQVLHVEWPAPFDYGVPITAYTLYADGVASTVPPATIGDVTEFLLVGLLPGTAHTFAVSATNAIGTGDTSSATTILTTSDVPAVPSQPRVDTDSCNGQCIVVTMQQSAYPGVPDPTTVVYDLQVFEGDVSLPTYYFANRTASELVVTFDREVKANYRVQSRGVNAAGASDWSEPALVGNDRSQYPPDPLNVTVSEVAGSGRALLVEWLIVANERSANLTFVISATDVENPDASPPPSPAPPSSGCRTSSQVGTFTVCTVHAGMASLGAAER